MTIKDYRKTALYYGNQAISYQYLINASLRAAASLPLRSGERAVIIGENRPEWYYAFYGIWINKGVAVAVDYLSSPEEILYILTDATPSLIITTETCRAAVDAALAEYPGTCRVTSMDELGKGEIELTAGELAFSDDHDPAIIIYTSGTTGHPKGVVLSRHNIAANLVGIWALRMFASTDVYGAILPFHHIYPLTGTVILPLMNGTSVVIIEKLASEVILRAFQEHGITHLFGIPRLYAVFHKSIMDRINANKAARMLFKISSFLPFFMRQLIFRSIQKMFGSKLHYFFSGGSKLDDAIMRDFKILGIKMVEGYGLSETAPLNTANGCPGVFKKGTIGKPLANVEMTIIDGEIAIKGDHVMKEYYNKPEETAAVFKDGWFCTGDEGSIDKNGYISITGRKKELIVLSNGKKVNPEEIEMKILALYPDMIREIGVFAKDNGLFAIVLPDFEFLKKNNLANIFETIKWQVIDKYNRASRDFRKIMNFKVVSTELPRTRIGKLKRFMFPSLITRETVAKEHPADPDEEQYLILKQRISALTGEMVYPDSHLELDLGIDSLAKVELESFITATFGVMISGQDLSGNVVMIDLYRLILERMTKMERLDGAGWHSILHEQVEPKIKGNGILAAFSKLLLYPFFKTYLRLNVNGRAAIPARSVIFAPNHQSFIDGTLITAALPGRIRRRTYFIANEKHFRKWWMKLIARYSHILTVNINVNLKESLQKIAYLLKHGKNVVIFPEGARTRDGSLMEFKKFFAILSKELDVPVVPVAIDGALHALPVDKIFPKPGTISVTFLPHVEPGDRTYETITAQVKETIEKSME